MIVNTSMAVVDLTCDEGDDCVITDVVVPAPRIRNPVGHATLPAGPGRRAVQPEAVLLPSCPDSDDSDDDDDLPSMDCLKTSGTKYIKGTILRGSLESLFPDGQFQVEQAPASPLQLQPQSRQEPSPLPSPPLTEDDLVVDYHRRVMALLAGGCREHATSGLPTPSELTTAERQHTRAGFGRRHLPASPQQRRAPRTVAPIRVMTESLAGTQPASFPMPTGYCTPPQSARSPSLPVYDLSRRSRSPLSDRGPLSSPSARDCALPPPPLLDDQRRHIADSLSTSSGPVSPHRTSPSTPSPPLWNCNEALAHSPSLSLPCSPSTACPPAAAAVQAGDAGTHLSTTDGHLATSAALTAATPPVESSVPSTIAAAAAAAATMTSHAAQAHRCLAPNSTEQQRSQSPPRTPSSQHTIGSVALRLGEQQHAFSPYLPTAAAAAAATTGTSDDSGPKHLKVLLGTIKVRGWIGLDNQMSNVDEAMSLLNSGVALDTEVRARILNQLCSVGASLSVAGLLASVLWKDMLLDRTALASFDWWWAEVEALLCDSQAALCSPSSLQVLELTVSALQCHTRNAASNSPQSFPLCPLKYRGRVRLIVDSLADAFPQSSPCLHSLSLLLGMAVEQYRSSQSSHQCTLNIAYVLKPTYVALQAVEDKVRFLSVLPPRLACRLVRIQLEERSWCGKAKIGSLSADESVSNLLALYRDTFPAPGLCEEVLALLAAVCGLLATHCRSVMSRDVDCRDWLACLGSVPGRYGPAFRALNLLLC